MGSAMTTVWPIEDYGTIEEDTVEEGERITVMMNVAKHCGIPEGDKKGTRNGSGDGCTMETVLTVR